MLKGAGDQKRTLKSFGVSTASPKTLGKNTLLNPGKLASWKIGFLENWPPGKLGSLKFVGVENWPPVSFLVMMEKVKLLFSLITNNLLHDLTQKLVNTTNVVKCKKCKSLIKKNISHYMTKHQVSYIPR